MSISDERDFYRYHRMPAMTENLETVADAFRKAVEEIQNAKPKYYDHTNYLLPQDPYTKYVQPANVDEEITKTRALFMQELERRKALEMRLEAIEKGLHKKIDDISARLTETMKLLNILAVETAKLKEERDFYRKDFEMRKVK